MELKGTIKELSPCFDRNEWVVSFYVDKNSTLLEKYESLKENPLDIKVTTHREKRTKDANAYYWTLLTQLANKLRISKPRMHNLLLRRYGVAETMEGLLVTLAIPDTDESAEKVLDEETYHLKPTSQVRTGNNGKDYRTYILLKGSSQYNTEEMSNLINGLVDECKEQGIDTATPDEIERMLQLYGEKH